MVFRILLVDDDKVDVMAFERAMLKSDLIYKLTSFERAIDAIQTLKRKEFDCIFLDYRLQGIDGLTMLKRIQSLGVTTPIVSITSQGNEKLAVEMMRAGAFDYFTKDQISEEKLHRILTNVETFHRERAQRFAAENELREITKNLAEAQEIAQLGSWKYDLKENTGYWSDHAYKLFGFDIKKDTATYDKFLSIVWDKDLERVKETFNKVSSTKEAQDIVFQINHPDGMKWISTRAQPVLDDDQVVTSIVGTSQDITQQKEVEVELVDAKQKAEAAAEAKTDFLSNMSHEIRTPMNAILGLTDILFKEKNMTPKGMDNLKLIKYSADNLLIIINDILDFSKIESGKVTLEHISFSPKKIVDNLLQTLNIKAEEKGIKLIGKVDDDVPEQVMGDPYRINQIFINLTNNAIKFTDKGEAIIRIKLAEKKEKSVRLYFSVEDTGIGIPEDKMATIFESFTQAQTDTTRLFGGTGLGLPITKRLIEMQGGKIFVESVHKVGSKFFFELDFDPAEVSKEQKSVTTIEEPTAVKDLKGAHILVAEDNAVNQMLIKQILGLWNVDLTVVGNGRLAVEAAATGKHELVLMDLQMPELTGYEATAGIRALEDEIISNMPIVALTADVFQETKDRVMSSGFNNYVTKPFKSDILYNTIVKHLEESRQWIASLKESE
jgi:PAS domain S-box-containing protein